MGDDRDTIHDAGKSGTGFPFVRVTICLLLAYPLSMGPVFKLNNVLSGGYFPDEAIMHFYWPIFALMDKSQTVDSIVKWYVGSLWGAGKSK